MNTASRLVLIFAIAFAFLIIAPALLGQPFALYPLMTTGDALDLLTPLILIPLYWLLFRLGEPPSPRQTIAFLLFAALWVEGQGMHLGANSIKHLMGDFQQTDAYTLTHFYDEVLSHYLWHIGIVGLALLLIWRQAASAITAPAKLWTELAAAVIYGFTFAISSIEAGTIPLMLPAAIVITGIGVLRRDTLRQQPVTAFLCAAHGIALLLLAIWFIRFGGFPQFSELGII